MFSLATVNILIYEKINQFSNIILYCTLIIIYYQKNTCNNNFMNTV